MSKTNALLVYWCNSVSSASGNAPPFRADAVVKEAVSQWYSQPAAETAVAAPNDEDYDSDVVRIYPTISDALFKVKNALCVCILTTRFVPA